MDKPKHPFEEEYYSKVSSDTRSVALEVYYDELNKFNMKQKPTKNNMKITRVYNDDWEAYYDEYGRLLAEGHSINTLHLLQLLGFKTDNIENNSEEFPPHLSQVNNG